MVWRWSAGKRWSPSSAERSVAFAPTTRSHTESCAKGRADPKMRCSLMSHPFLTLEATLKTRTVVLSVLTLVVGVTICFAAANPTLGRRKKKQKKKKKNKKN